jgi:hypothetical protein
MLIVVQRAIEGAEGSGRTVLERFAETYRAGRQVRFSTGPAEFRTVIVDRELERAVEEALTGGTE